MPDSQIDSQTDLARQKRNEAKNFYARFRRPFYKKRQRIPGSRAKYRHTLVPDCRRIRPNTKDFVAGRRTGLLDRRQGVYGYFFGGGWVFGLVENDNFRATAASLEAYKSAKSGDTITAQYRLGKPHRAQDAAFPERTLAYGQSLPKNWGPRAGYSFVNITITVGKDIPVFADLDPIDACAVDHDLGLRRVDEDEWAARLAARDKEQEQDQDISEDTLAAFDGARQNVNKALRIALSKIQWGSIEDAIFADHHANPDKDTLQRRLSQLCYQRTLGAFSQFMLRFVDNPPRRGDPDYPAYSRYIKSGAYGQNVPRASSEDEAYTKPTRLRYDGEV